MFLVKGKETKLTKGDSVAMPANEMIGLYNPENPKDAYLFFTKEGTQEISEETSRKAVGGFMIQ